MDKKELLIYIRSEINLNEHRCPIVPQHISKLKELGYSIYIESSKNRVYSDAEYQKEGAIITTNKWYMN